KLYGATYRDQLAVDQWLMWQMSGLGPMAGQNHHFNKYAPLMGENLTYAQDRYTQETACLYRVLNTQLAQNDYVAGDFFSIADMAIWPWASLWKGRKQTLEDKSHMARWLQACAAPRRNCGPWVTFRSVCATPQPSDKDSFNHLFKAT
ncbi:glutathione binding-like protein, partial [Planktomarina sp.]|uniref:glutathione binding-like protein n=1 Tax=Planktomarina sp. TaxID=2024851 RepID=UPI0028918BD1|nr:glutathione binding-like protein [Planktomarina sp.]